MKTTKRTDHAETRTTEFNGNPVVEEFACQNDLALAYIPGKSTKDIVLVSGAEAVKNVVEAVVNTYRGELQLAKAKGMPYFESMLGNRIRDDISTWVAYMQDGIENTNGVESISKFEYGIQQTASNRRAMVYSATINTKYGETSVTNGVAQSGITRIAHVNLGS